MHSLNSSLRIFSISFTPSSPLYANPQSVGLPTQTKSAPRASALKISVPCLTPPSTCTGIFPCTASTTSGRASNVASAPFSCLPPWFDTTTPSTPWWTASSASSPVAIPLTHTSISGLQTSFSHAMSRSQFSVGFAACEWKVTGPEGATHFPFSIRPGLEGPCDSDRSGVFSSPSTTSSCSAGSSSCAKFATLKCGGSLN